MIDVALDDFVSLHISIIMLLGQYVKSLGKAGGRIQTIDFDIFQNAINRSTKLTEKFYSKAPPVKVFFAKKLRYISKRPRNV